MSNILNDLIARMSADDAVTAKTAAAEETPAPAAPSADARMLETVRTLSSKLASEQATPAQPASAVDALQKIASDAAAFEDELMKKQARAYGHEMCDGFLERLAAFDGPIGGAAKTASATDLEKVAAEAYAKGAADYEKRAAADFEEGYNQQVAQIHKIASEVHFAGQQSAANVLEALAQRG